MELRTSTNRDACTSACTRPMAKPPQQRAAQRLQPAQQNRGEGDQSDRREVQAHTAQCRQQNAAQGGDNPGDAPRKAEDAADIDADGAGHFVVLRGGSHRQAGFCAVEEPDEQGSGQDGDSESGHQRVFQADGIAECARKGDDQHVAGRKRRGEVALQLHAEKDRRHALEQLGQAQSHQHDRQQRLPGHRAQGEALDQQADAH